MVERPQEPIYLGHVSQWASGSGKASLVLVVDLHLQSEETHTDKEGAYTAL